MLEKDSIHQRGRALEDEFFHRVDEKLRADLRAKLERDGAVERMRLATGFNDTTLIEHLVDAGFTPSSMTAVALIPLVFVAWADGEVTSAERQAILSAALHRGVKNQPTAFAMLEGWLHDRPSAELWNLWKDYASSLGESLTPTLASALQQEVLRLATAVAEASGGYFGRGKISAPEKAVLDQLAGLIST